MSTLLWEQYYQNASSMWDSIKYVAQSGDEGYLLVASNQPKYYASSVMVIKVNSSGGYEWSSRYPLYGPSGFAQTADGYVFAGGLVEAYPDNPFVHKIGDLTVIATDHAGNEKWRLNYPHNGFKTLMAKTSDSGFVLCGTEDSSSNVYANAWIIKTDSKGKVQWNTTILDVWPSGQLTGELTQIIPTFDGGYAIVGHKSFVNGTFVSLDNGELLFLKLDATGKLLWNQTYDLQLSSWSTKGVLQTSDSGFVLIESIGSDQTPKVLKIDNSGRVLWTKTYSTNFLPNHSSLDTAIETSEGGLAFVGNLPTISGSGYIWVVKTDSYGAIEWNQTFGGQKYIEYGYKSGVIFQDTNGCLVIGGGWARGESSAYYYLAKIDASLPIPTSSPSVVPEKNSSDFAQYILPISIVFTVSIALVLVFYFKRHPKRNLN